MAATGKIKCYKQGISISVYLPPDDYEQVLKAYLTERNASNKKTPPLWLREVLREKISKMENLKDIPEEWRESIKKRKPPRFYPKYVTKDGQSVDTVESKKDENPEYVTIKPSGADLLNPETDDSSEKSKERKSRGELGLFGL